MQSLLEIRQLRLSRELFLPRLQATNLRRLSCNLLLLLLHLVHQHRRKLVIAHAVDPSGLTADHELRIDLRDFLGDESVLQRPVGSSSG
jgi:hypothetical protein